MTMKGGNITGEQLQDFLRGRRFGELFGNLGWDCEGLSPVPPLKVGDKTLEVTPIAEKRNFMVCVCDDAGDLLAAKTARKHAAVQLSHSHYEHLLIICGKDRQRWVMPIRPQGHPMKLAETEWHHSQSAHRLAEKLPGLFFHISDEDGLYLSDVVSKMHMAFVQNNERVTRGFYAKFQKELERFAEFIKGVRDKVEQKWYAALTLNRLMFIYFLQKRGFLDGNINYLADKLQETRRQYGENKFERVFYRNFLRRLFAEGLNAPQAERGDELQKMIGKVPYLDGGLFDLHDIEKSHPKLDIADAAFEGIFAFFDKYQWHLDTRPQAAGNEINPDVIGYIFEKYVNNRAKNRNKARDNPKMGAYYTQEDVTGYIARSSIIPFLLEQARAECANAFDAQNGIWRFLREKPQRFIYPAVRKGCDTADSELPTNIRRGLDAKAPNLQERRVEWNTPADEPFALPGETWREVIARRIRCQKLTAKMARGEICTTADLITDNLDIERFAADALDYEGADFIDAFYAAIAGKPGQKDNGGRRGISVLDPACGSGAFLFAALNVLEPLYQKCLNRMEEFVGEDDTLRKQGKRKGAKKHPRFRKILADVKGHPNKEYWVYKNIILNNLYGVDLMREAAEIAKLRLFLKLAAAAGDADMNEDNLGLEPLPDIDFNIRSGNSLVGYASMKQFDEMEGKKLPSIANPDAVRAQMILVQMADNHFRKSQDGTPEEYRAAKRELEKQLRALNRSLNEYLSVEYGGTKRNAEKWAETTRPFHWLANFYDIVENRGGFDVVIGNPPYVEYGEVKEYVVRGYRTKECGNLYAFFLERALSLSTGRTGWIIPISWVSTDRMNAARNVVSSAYPLLHISNYADGPARLFNDAHQKLSIVLCGKEAAGIYTTGFAHWYQEERGRLFGTLSYHPTEWQGGIIRKFGDALEESIVRKIERHAFPLPAYLSGRPSSIAPVYLNQRLMMWVKCFLAPKQSREFHAYYPVKKASAPELSGILNSGLFFWHWQTRGDCWHLIKEDLQSFRADLAQMPKGDRAALSDLAKVLEADLENNKKYVGTAQTDYEYYHKKSKPIIDQIDAVLADHYGLTPEELDYIVNYDIKYRLGRP